jgi:signal peptidase
MRRVKRMGRTASRVAGLAILASSLLFLGFVGLGPRTGAYRTLTVLTGSMDPTIPPGAMVVVKPVDPQDLRVGDVITYQTPVGDRRVVTHRIVDIPRPGPNPVVQTKGDANNAVDPWLARLDQAPAWRVHTVVPFAGRLINLTRSDAVRRTTTLLVPALLALTWLADIWRTAPVPGAPGPLPRPVPLPALAPAPSARPRRPDGRPEPVVVPIAAFALAGALLWLAGTRASGRRSFLLRWAGSGGHAH